MSVRAERDDLAVVGTCKIHCCKNHLARNAASLKAVEDTRVVNNHPLRSGALVRHFAHLHRFGTCTFFGGLHPRLKNAAFLGLLVLNCYHSCSKSNNRFFISMPYSYPPILPCAAMTRWQGMIRAIGLRPTACPTACAERHSTILAISP